jgi:hypothetical protein
MKRILLVDDSPTLLLSMEESYRLVAALDAQREADGREIRAGLDVLYQSYVMAQQRSAHDRSHHEGKGALIELF